jgi:hypothetical protein
MYIIRYVSPLFLLLVFAAFVYQQFTDPASYFAALLKDPLAMLSVSFIALVGLLFTFLVAQSVRRWRRQEMLTEEASI